ncbi:MAG: SCP-2 sterol transfer family protein [Beggiatoa sp. IS2]|nr:MAG: SCP-2 sterol transfer family protein [Beggiatoa sp. IS2]
MAGLFSEAWMKDFMEEWNKEPDMATALASISFNSNISYGFIDQEQPTGVIVVQMGRVVSAGKYNNETLNWDLRATPENWEKWVAKGLGMAGLGMAYMSGKLKFKVGDYTAMIKDPRMAGPFIKSFTVMGRVKV